MNTSADQAPLEAKPASTAVVAPPPRAFARAENVNPRSGIGNRKSDLLVYALLCAGALMFLVPFYFVLNGSLKTDAEVQAGEFISPTNAPMFGNYPKALSKDRWSFQPALANTVVVTTLTVLGQIVSCSLVGFGFARFRFRGRGILFMIMLSTMMLPAQVTMIPVFVLFKTLGMVDSFWPLVIPAWLASPFFVFMFRQFFWPQLGHLLAVDAAAFRPGDRDRGDLHIPGRVE